MVVGQQKQPANTGHLRESPHCTRNMPLFCLAPFAKLPHMICAEHSVQSLQFYLHFKHDVALGLTIYFTEMTAKARSCSETC